MQSSEDYKHLTLETFEAALQWLAERRVNVKWKPLSVSRPRAFFQRSVAKRAWNALCSSSRSSATTSTHKDYHSRTHTSDISSSHSSAPTTPALSQKKFSFNQENEPGMHYALPLTAAHPPVHTGPITPAPAQMTPCREKSKHDVLINKKIFAGVKHHRAVGLRERGVFSGRCDTPVVRDGRICQDLSVSFQCTVTGLCHFPVNICIGICRTKRQWQ